MIFLAAIENENDRLKAERLYIKYRNLMYSEAYSILENKQLAEDSVLESFIRIIKNLHKIEEENCPRTAKFLVIICRNVSKTIKMQTVKTNNFEISEKDTEEIGADSLNPENIVISEKTVEDIKKIIMSLKETYSDPFLLKYDYGYSTEEIAKILGIKKEAAAKRITRAKSMIIEKLNKENLEIARGDKYDGQK